MFRGGNGLHVAIPSCAPFIIGEKSPWHSLTLAGAEMSEIALDLKQNLTSCSLLPPVSGRAGHALQGGSPLSEAFHIFMNS